MHRILDTRGLADLDDGRTSLPEVSKGKHTMDSKTQEAIAYLEEQITVLQRQESALLWRQAQAKQGLMMWTQETKRNLNGVQKSLKGNRAQLLRIRKIQEESSPNRIEKQDRALSEWSPEELVEYSGRGQKEREIIESELARRWSRR